MSDLNPYAKYLDSRPLETILAATPSEITALLEKIGEAKSAQPPAPGKWSPAEIISHLADCELVFAFRLRQTLAEDNHTIQPFDQDKWAATYAGISASQALATFSAMTFNFLLNNLVTFRDRRLKGRRLITGLLTFYIACSIGALTNVSFAQFMLSSGAPWYLAGISGMAISSVWNYGVNTIFTWRRDRTTA